VVKNSVFGTFREFHVFWRKMTCSHFQAVHGTKSANHRNSSHFFFVFFSEKPQKTDILSGPCSSNKCIFRLENRRYSHAMCQNGPKRNHLGHPQKRRVFRDFYYNRIALTDDYTKMVNFGAFSAF